jgi:hypothetical protein
MTGNIAEAKRRLPLPALLQRLGLGDCAKQSTRCPFHDDKHNSFSVWLNDAGMWFFKCHAGCGHGDEITFLELHNRISTSEAIKLYLEMACVNGATQSFTREQSNKDEQAPLDWPVCVEAFTDNWIQRLAKWRGYSIEFCSWLRDKGLVGLYNGCIAFPVHDGAGNVIGAHYRAKDGKDWSS